MRLRTLYNMWGVAISSGEIMSGQALADELLTLAADLGDDLSWCEAHIAQAGSLYNRCRLAEAISHASAVLDRPREELAAILPVSDVLQASLYGGAAAAALGTVSRAQRYLGQIEWARHLEEADALGDILGPLSSAVISVWLRDFEAVRTLSSELEETGTALRYRPAGRLGRDLRRLGGRSHRGRRSRCLADLQGSGQAHRCQPTSRPQPLARTARRGAAESRDARRGCLDGRRRPAASRR